MIQTTGSIPVGSFIKLHHNGTYRNFLVVHQGKPSEIYDDSCSGTWLVMNDIYEMRKMHGSHVNIYANCLMHTYLNGEWFQLFDENTRDTIKSIKIPYGLGNGVATVQTGANGLPCRVFFLASYEVGLNFNFGDVHPAADGAKLDYFENGYSTTGTNGDKREAKLNGTQKDWWLRTPIKDESFRFAVVGSMGNPTFDGAANENGVRPAIILPTSLNLSEVPGESKTYTINWNQAPFAPTSITIPETIRINKPVEITWIAGTDPEGDPVTHELERSVDAGNYAQISSATATSYTDTAAANWTTVQYRVRAVDNKGAASAYTASVIRRVDHNVDPTISGQNADLGTVSGPPSYTYQVDDADVADTLTITEQLDGTVIRTIPGAARNTDYTFAVDAKQYLSLAAGQHRMSILVSDNHGNTTTRSLTFSRAVAAIDYDYGPLPVDTMPTQVLVTLRCDADPASVDVKVCNNAYDAAPTWEAARPGQKHPYTNTTKTAEKWGVMVRVRITPSAEYPQVKCRALSVAVK